MRENRSRREREWGRERGMAMAGGPEASWRKQAVVVHIMGDG